MIPMISARLARDPRLAARLAGYHARLRALPRRQRRLMRRLRLSLAAAALLLALAPDLIGFPRPVRSYTVADIAVVNGEVDADDNDLCSLVEAIDNANDTTTGLVHDDCAAGDPLGADTITLPVDGAFSVAYYLADASYGYTGLPLITSTVTIAGNGATIDRDTEYDYDLRFFTVVNDSLDAAGDLTLNDLTLSGGRQEYYPGGAVAVYSGALALNGCTISGNAAAAGGGLALYDSTTLLTDSTIDDNAADDGGGGIFAVYGTLTLAETGVSGNDTTGQHGGGVYASSLILALDGATIAGNTAPTGAGLALQHVTAGVTATTISGNVAAGAEHGGGFYLLGGSVTLTDRDRKSVV